MNKVAGSCGKSGEFSDRSLPKKKDIKGNCKRDSKKQDPQEGYDFSSDPPGVTAMCALRDKGLDFGLLEDGVDGVNCTWDFFPQVTEN